MNKFNLVVALFIANCTFSQTTEEKEATMKPSLWLDIWDAKQNVPSFNVLQVGFNDIPRDIFYRGTLVECLEFDDSNGHNLVFLTQTGKFPVSEKDENGKYKKVNDKAEIYAYMFTKSGNANYRNMWKMMDAQACENLDLYVGFTKGSLSITDVDGDNIAEVSFQHTKSCRSDVSPADRFLTCYESSQKFQYIGITQLEGMPLEQATKDIKTPMAPEIGPLLDEKWTKFAEDSFIQFN